jgi:predicted metal-dependent hydrolase
VKYIAVEMSNTKCCCTWPPPFSVRYSARARAVSLRICAQRGLQIVAPRFFDAAQAPQVLQQHRQWIERAWQRIQPQATANEPEAPPQQLSLLALNEIWSIRYLPEAHNKKLWQEASVEKCLIVNASSTHRLKIKKILLCWLQQRARFSLLPWLATLSQQTGLSYMHASVRNATTRWGSCSARKTISLNGKLLLLPPHLVEYVLLHELCHTLHLNHSRRFWDLVKQFSPDCHYLRKQLKQANRQMPIYLERI